MTDERDDAIPAADEAFGSAADTAFGASAADDQERVDEGQGAEGVTSDPPQAWGKAEPAGEESA